MLATNLVHDAQKAINAIRYDAGESLARRRAALRELANVVRNALADLDDEIERSDQGDE